MLHGILIGFTLGLITTGYVIQTKFVSREFIIKNKVCIDREWGKLK